ncbi:MAG: CPBP family glutamic-type intramembrane protease [Chloroflexota bacterium]
MKQAIARNPLLFVLGCLGALGLIAALFLREQSFPVATVDFRILGPEAEQQAANYVRERGFALDGYRSAVAFGVDDIAKNYVHREAGLSALNSLARDKISVWYWHVRFFRELREEEFSVYVTPDGRLVGFFHTLPEASPGGNPEQATAQVTAEAFLSALGRDISRYRLVSASAVKRESRVDNFFTWEERDFTVSDATSRVDVWLLGDQIGGFSDYLKVPEEWRRAQALETNRGNVLDLAGWLLTYALVLAMAYVSLLRLRAGGVRWRFAVGLAVVLASIGIATGLNSVPLLVIGYPTTSTFGAYLTSSLQQQAGGLVPTGVAVVLAGIAGDWLYGRALPGKVRPSVLFSLRGLFTAELPRAVLAGYAMAGIWLGYVTVFYTLGSRYFGAWSPAEVPYRNLMSTYFPGLYPLTVGFGAAVSEETMFRMFAVPFLLWLGWRWLDRPWLLGRRALRVPLMAPVAVVAVVVPAAIWGSLHSTYPQQPFFARAIELTIVGSLSALLMFRFGIMATITAHYVYNASVIGGLFLLSTNNYLRASAVVVVGLPLVLIVPAWLRRRAGLSLRKAEEVASPATRLPAAVATSAVQAPAGTAWSPPAARLRELLLLGAACIVVALAWQVPRFGDEAKVNLGQAEVGAAADELAADLGWDPDAYAGVTSFSDLTFGNGTAYLLRRLGTSATNRFLTEELPSYAWQKRFYRPLDRHELTLRFDQSGHFHSLSRQAPEDEAGARLSVEDARRLAEGFVRRYGRADALAWEPITASSSGRTFLAAWARRRCGFGLAY